MIISIIKFPGKSRVWGNRVRTWWRRRIGGWPRGMRHLVRKLYTVYDALGPALMTQITPKGHLSVKIFTLRWPFVCAGWFRLGYLC